MYDKLLESLRICQSKTTENVGAIAANERNSAGLAALFPTEFLRDVPTALQALGIDKNCDHLVPFIIEDTAEKSTNDTELFITALDDLKQLTQNRAPAPVT